MLPHRLSGADSTGNWISPPVGPDGFTDAYFVCTLGDGNRHYIHNSDTAHDERDAGNTGQENLENSH